MLQNKNNEIFAEPSKISEYSHKSVATELHNRVFAISPEFFFCRVQFPSIILNRKCCDYEAATNLKMIIGTVTVNTQIHSLIGSTPRTWIQKNCYFHEIFSMIRDINLQHFSIRLSVSPVRLLVFILLNNGADSNYNFKVYIIVIVYIYCQLQIFGTCSQCISKHFKLDSDIWYANQEMKMMSISMAFILLFALLCTIGNIANLCFDNNFYYISIGAHIICIQYANNAIVFFILSVIILLPIYKNVKTSFNNNHDNTSNAKTQMTRLSTVSLSELRNKNSKKKPRLWISSVIIYL